MPQNVKNEFGGMIARGVGYRTSTSAVGREHLPGSNQRPTNLKLDVLTDTQSNPG